LRRKFAGGGAHEMLMWLVVAVLAFEDACDESSRSRTDVDR
jgi:hypothetical protein